MYDRNLQAAGPILAGHGQQYFCIFVDPVVGNQAAIRAYEKAGFQKVAEQAAVGQIWMVYEG